RRPARRSRRTTIARRVFCVWPTSIILGQVGPAFGGRAFGRLGLVGRAFGPLGLVGRAFGPLGLVGRAFRPVGSGGSGLRPVGGRAFGACGDRGCSSWKNMRKGLGTVTVALLVALRPGAAAAQAPEATSLFGKPLVSAAPTGDTKTRLEADLAKAQAEYDRDPSSADAAIWLGR